MWSFIITTFTTPQTWASGELYFKRIVDNEITTSKAMRQCAERYFADRLLEKTPEFPYYFDEDWAHVAITFFSQCLKHHELSLWGQPFVLESWQISFVGQAFGWRSKADRSIPRFNRCHLYVARKNGKTSLIAGLLILGMVLAPMAAQSYSVATREEQSRVCWQQAHRMIAQAANSISSQFKLSKHGIEMPQKSVTFKPLGSNSKQQDGLNCHLVGFDECYAISDPNVFEVVHSSQGSNPAYQNFYITTAQEDAEAPYSHYINQAKNILEGIRTPAGERILAHLYELDANDDPEDPSVWIKANPNLGVSVMESFFREELELCKAWPSKKKLFQIKHLNMFAGSAESWLDMEKWNDIACIYPEPPEGYKDTILALDIGRVSDLSCATVMFRYRDGRRYIKPLCMVAKNVFEALPTYLKDKYMVGLQEKTLVLCSGDFVDDEFIAHHIKELADIYQPTAIGYDSWSAIHVTAELSRQKGLGHKIEPVSQSGKDLNSASMEFERLVTGKKLLHPDSKFLAWQANNAVAHIDHKMNLHIQKDSISSLAKIDAIIASLYCTHLDIQYPLKSKQIYRSI